MIIDSEAQLRAGEDVIHTTRVAVRRLRSTIRVFSELFDASEARIWKRSWSGGQTCSALCGISTSWRNDKPHCSLNCVLN